jgi:glycosyltransferase involved in cell wall biosynthesis
MRIALVTQHSPLDQSVDAANCSDRARVAAISRVLAQLGHRITIYARKEGHAVPDQAILAPGVTVEHVPAGPAIPLGPEELGKHTAEFANYLTRRWRARPPDVAQGNCWMSGLAALAAARGLGIPVAQAFQSPGYALGRCTTASAMPAAHVRLEASIARAAAAVLTSSSDEAAQLIRLGVPRAAITLVPCGVDTVSFTPRRRSGPAAKRHQLLAVGPLDEHSGLPTVLRALAEIPEAMLTIAGGPPRSQLRRDSRYLRLSALARELGVRQRVQFAGKVSQQELVRLLHEADILVSAAPYEPSGMAAIQAMACGVPVVASAVGSHRDAVIDGTTGLLVPPGQPRILAARLRRLLASPALLEAYGIAAADRARSRYSWDRIGRETLAAYERLMPARPAVAAARRSEMATPQFAPA